MIEPAVKVYKINDRYPRMSAKVEQDRYSYRIGYVATPDGVVGFYTQHDFTVLTFARGGRQVDGRYARGFTERGLVTTCRRFAAAAAAILGKAA